MGRIAMARAELKTMGFRSPHPRRAGAILAVRCPLILPTLLAENLVNGDMELDANWQAINTPATNERSTEQVHGGSFSRKVVTDSSSPSEGVMNNPGFTAVAGAWYQMSGWAYPTAGECKLLDNNGIVSPTQTDGLLNIWTQLIVTGRAGSAGTVRVSAKNSGTAASTFYIDDFSCRRIAPESMYGVPIYLGGHRFQYFFDLGAIRFGTQVGIVVGADGSPVPSMGVRVYYDRADSFLYMAKCVRGVWTDLTSGSAGATATNFRLDVVGDTFAMYKRGPTSNFIQVGTTQIITDPLGPWLRGVSTYGGNSLGMIMVTP